MSRSLQTVDSNFIKALDEITSVVNIFSIMRQTKESFGKIMDADAKMDEDMKIAVDKLRVARRSVYQSGAVNDVDSVLNYYNINMYIPLLEELFKPSD